MELAFITIVPNNIVTSETGTIQKNIKDPTNSSSLYIYYDADVGRLGNLLFGLASAYGIAHQSKRQLICKSDLKELNRLLPNLEIDIKTLPGSWEKLHEKAMARFDAQILDLPKDNVTISGYLQSFKYFEDVSEEIFKTYSDINPPVLEKVKSFKESVRQEAKKRLSYHNPTFVCLHVRREDFLLKMNVDLGYKVASEEDINFAMNWIQKKYKQVLFIVASNGKSWCERHLKKENVFISNFTSAEDDFTLMQSCDHMIMTVGMFGWWAAWMTSHRGGDAMYYRNPFTVGSFMHGQFNRATYFPEHWLSYGNNSVMESKDVAL